MIEAIEVSLSRPIDVIAGGRQRHAHRLRRHNVDQALARRQAQGQRGLALAAVDRLDAGAENLAEKGGTLQARARCRRR